MENILLPMLYFPPISYFIDWNMKKKISIEGNENYQNQTLRNRMDILSSHGRLSLSIPIAKSKKRYYRNIEISINDKNWKKNHWKSLETSYRNSPYFEYYEDDIKKLIYQDNKYLFNFNKTILDWIIKIYKIKNYKITKNYIINYEGTDFRNIYKSNFIKNKKIPKYIQVFSDRCPFENNLSILDLLFNLGPNYILCK